MFRTLFEVLRYAFSELANKVKRKRVARKHRADLAEIRAKEEATTLRKAALADELHTRRQEAALAKHEIEEDPYED